MSAPVSAWIELIILPLGPITSPILSTGILTEITRGAYGDISSGPSIASAITSRIASRASLACRSAAASTSDGIPSSLVSSCRAVTKSLVPATLKSMSPYASSAPRMSVSVTYSIVPSTGSAIRPMAMPATGAWSGTPALSRDSVEAQTDPIDVEPLELSASTLSLLNAGVPLKAPVAGIAMGLIAEPVDGTMEYVTLTDILGAEDAYGDMDFKVAGTKDFVTALQLDTKLDGIPSEVLAAALRQAKDARLAILEVMAEAIDGPDEMSPYAPRVISVKIPVDKIGEVIGPKGKMINSIQADTGADISIEDDGTIYIGATNGPAAEAARSAINSIANPTMPEVGERFLGTVVKTTAFGAFVSLTPGKDGLVHISKLGSGKRVNKVEDVVNVGDKLQVEIAEIDSRGKISLVPLKEEAAASTGAPAAG